MKRSITWAVLVGFLLGAVAHAQDIDFKDKAAVAARLDAALESAAPAQFWGGVAVAKDGTLVYTKGFAGSGLPEVKPNTLIDIGSISKQVTSAIVLKLESEGKLSIDAPVSQWFPVGGMAPSVKLWHLLTHTSGMSDDGAIQPLNFADRDEAVRRAMNSEFRSAPGERWDYCNAGYIVLAAVVEKATERPFEVVVKERLFKPAAMGDTGFLDGEGLDKERCAPRITRMLGGGERRIPLFTAPDGEPWAWGLRGAGGVLTTFEDLALWDKALSGEEVLGAAVKDKMWTPVLNGYAMGWQVSSTGVGRKVSHSGRTRGFSATLSRFIDQGVMIAVVTGENSDPHQLERVLVQAIFPSEREGVNARVDTTGTKLNEHKAGQFDGAAVWEVAPGETITATLRCDELAVATLRLAPGTARRVAAELAAITQGDGGPGNSTVMFGLKPFELAGNEVALPDGIEVRILNAYRGQTEDGKPIVDSRPTLILMDQKSGFWPLIVRMDPGVASQLVRGLESAAK